MPKRSYTSIRKTFLAGKRNHEGYFECEKCGLWINTPEVDHIKGRGSHPELKYTLSNLQILCPQCHYKKTNNLP